MLEIALKLVVNVKPHSLTRLTIPIPTVARCKLPLQVEHAGIPVSGYQSGKSRCKALDARETSRLNVITRLTKASLLF